MKTATAEKIETNVKPLFGSEELYRRWRMRIVGRNRICGGIPRNKELIKSWVVASTGFDDDKTEELVKADLELVVNEKAEKTWIGFGESRGNLVIEARNVKAMLKQSASVLAITNQKRGSKQIFAEGMEVKAMDGGPLIPLAKAISGTHEGPIHVVTAQGPRTALRRMDYVDPWELTFQIWLLDTEPGEKRHIGEDTLIRILKHAQENGLGASRSQGEGKFDVVEMERIKD